MDNELNNISLVNKKLTVQLKEPLNSSPLNYLNNSTVDNKFLFYYTASFVTKEKSMREARVSNSSTVEKVQIQRNKKEQNLCIYMCS